MMSFNTHAHTHTNMGACHRAQNPNSLLELHTLDPNQELQTLAAKTSAACLVRWNAFDAVELAKARSAKARVHLFHLANILGSTSGSAILEIDA